MSQHDIGACVVGALEQYFRDLDGEKPARSTTWY
jgi:Fis family transcriptional regulator